jgi:4-hydroxy-3-methylbut-2-en-1-yl diphosphate reductase
LTAGASAPEHLVQEVVSTWHDRALATCRRLEIMPENVRFGLPPEIVETIAAAPAV